MTENYEGVSNRLYNLAKKHEQKIVNFGKITGLALIVAGFIDDFRFLEIAGISLTGISYLHKL